MESRIRKILEILLKSEFEQTVKMISMQLDVSEKTIRDEINLYIQNQENYPIHIVLCNKGYKAVIKNSDLKKSFLSSLDRLFEGPDHRIKNTLKKLLLNEGYMKIETLADEQYVSVPTMNRIIKGIKEILETYHLEIKARPGYGICIAGDEMNKRLCYVHLLTQDPKEDMESIVNECRMTIEDYYCIDYIIRKSLDEKNYDLTEIGIKNLAIHLMYAITRMKSGSFINEIPLHYEISEEETSVAQNIIHRLGEEFNIVFPSTEVDYVRIHLLSKRGNLNQNVVKITLKTEKIIREIHNKILEVAGFDFNTDLELLSMLALHIEPMLSRIQFGIDMPNPVLKEIKLKFPTAYECAVIASEYLMENYDLKVSDDELGYLSLHYNLALERLKKHEMQNVLIVCGSGAGTAKLLQRKIETQFHIDSNKISLCSVRELKNQDLSKYDVIVSSVNIPDSKGKRVIMVDDILSNLPSLSMEDKTCLEYYLNSELVFFQKEFKTRKEVIDYCCDKVIQTYHLKNEFKDEVWKREKLSSTDIGNLVAIPHAFSMCTDNTVFCICTLKKAILWKNHKVKYVFLISFGKSDLKISHDINEKLIRLILDTNWVSKLDSVRTLDQLKKIL